MVRADLEAGEGRAERDERPPSSSGRSIMSGGRGRTGPRGRRWIETWWRRMRSRSLSFETFRYGGRFGETSSSRHICLTACCSWFGFTSSKTPWGPTRSLERTRMQLPCLGLGHSGGSPRSLPTCRTATFAPRSWGSTRFRRRGPLERARELRRHPWFNRAWFVRVDRARAGRSTRARKAARAQGRDLPCGSDRGRELRRHPWFNRAWRVRVDRARAHGPRPRCGAIFDAARV